MSSLERGTEKFTGKTERKVVVHVHHTGHVRIAEIECSIKRRGHPNLQVADCLPNKPAGYGTQPTEQAPQEA